MTSSRMGLCCAAVLAAAGCGTASPSDNSAAGGSLAVALSPTNLDLQVSGNSCWNNGSQSYFQVKNDDSSDIKLSDITSKFWVNDTSVGPVDLYLGKQRGCPRNGQRSSRAIARCCSRSSTRDTRRAGTS